jgi:molecular chaperone DnaK
MKVSVVSDLGTTNSCVAVMEGSSPVVITNSEGKRTTPSVIGFSDDGIKTGDSAKRQAVVNSEKTVYSIKRFMGEKYDDLINEVKNVSYNVKKSSNGMPSVDIDGKKYTPQEISAMVLQKMKKTAEDYLGQKVDRAVITVPAYFDDSQRQSTKEAGEIAGLKVERIINEPTAAALAYGLDKKDGDMKVVVFDLGGGTFDISILELGDGVFEVKSTNGDTHLGGDDFDKVIVDWLAEEFMKDYAKVDLRKDKQAHQRMREAAEKAKVELSSSSETEINLPYIIPIDNVPQHLVKKLTRSQFEKLSDKLIEKVKSPCVKALKDSGLSKNDIDEVILVGGSTRMPIVQKIAKDIFGKEPSKNVNPDEAVAIGAAIQGGVLTGDVTDVLLLDVTPLSLGIETLGGVMTRLIDANTTIPVTKLEIFSTASDNQPGVEIHVLQGERSMAKDNKTLGRFHLDGLPPAPRGIPQIEVKFDIDANGILHVSATDKATGKNQRIRIEGSSSLTETEIEKMKQEAKENAEKDKKEREKIDKLNQADALVFNTEKQIKDFGDKLQESDKNELSEIVEKLKEAHKNKEMSEIDQLSSKLNETWTRISTNLYQQSQNENVNMDENSDGINAEDVEFEEVNDKK